MALAAKLQLRQSQSLVMTPQLMQSIKLLQLTHVELERFVDEEIERNPLLDRAEPRDDAATDQLQKPMPRRKPCTENDWFETDAAWTSEAISDKLDTSLENIFPDDPGTTERLGPDLASQWKSRRRAAVPAAFQTASTWTTWPQPRSPCAIMSASRSPWLFPIPQRG